jgi:hypothetical protein
MTEREVNWLARSISGQAAEIYFLIHIFDRFGFMTVLITYKNAITDNNSITMNMIISSAARQKASMPCLLFLYTI